MSDAQEKFVACDGFIKPNFYDLDYSEEEIQQRHAERQQ